MEYKEPIRANVAVYESSVEGIKRNLTDLNTQITEKKKAYDRFKASIGAKIIQISDAITGLKRQLQDLNEEKREIERKIAELEGKIRDSNSENVTLRQQLENLQRSKGDIEGELQSINEQINQIRIIVSGLDPSADPNSNISDQLNDIIATLRGQDNRGPSGLVGVGALNPQRDQEVLFPGPPRSYIGDNYLRKGGRKYKTKKGGKKYKSRMIKCRSKSRKQRGGFIALFKQKPSGQTTSTTSGKKNKNKKSKKDKKRFKKTTMQANDPYNF